MKKTKTEKKKMRPAGKNISNPAISEGRARIESSPGIFYNPHMRLCRDLSSLWVGTLPPLARVLDGFCASGIRGLRYKLENSNVGAVTFLDHSANACKLVERNLKLNKVEASSSSVVCDDIERLLLSDSDFELIEIDPFGTPMPHLDALMRPFPSATKKTRYLSITATDTAVLCGAHHAACVKNYSARPIDNEFCHESALRILIGRVARSAAEQNWAIKPLFCFSHRHYVKVLAVIEMGAEEAVEAVKQSMRYVTHCPGCLYHEMGTFPLATCPRCAHQTDWAGPMWGGKWAEKETVEKMMKGLERKKDYLDAKTLAPLLATILSECEGPTLYYDIHELASKHKLPLARSEKMVDALKKGGFFASRTHFSPTSIRTDAPLDEILKRMKAKE